MLPAEIQAHQHPRGSHELWPYALAFSKNLLPLPSYPHSSAMEAPSGTILPDSSLPLLNTIHSPAPPLHPPTPVPELSDLAPPGPPAPALAWLTRPILTSLPTSGTFQM